MTTKADGFNLSPPYYTQTFYASDWAPSRIFPTVATATPTSILSSRSLVTITDFLYAKFGSGVTGMRGRFIAQWTALIWEAIFLYIFTLMTELGAAIPVLILFSLGVQMAEGTSYGIVPYVIPDATGAVSGIVGAGGNFGAVMWGRIFRFGPPNERHVFRIIAAIVLGLSCVTPLIHIRGYATVFTPPKGEPASIGKL